MKKYNSLRVFIALTMLALAVPLPAQWSGDPSKNLVISQLCDTWSAKMIYSHDHYYITYTKGLNSALCHYLQVLDFNGKAQFNGDGLLISNFPSQTTSLSDLKIDLKGNLILAFGDNRNDAYSDIVVYKIDTAGNQLWGLDGISLSLPATEESKPLLTVNPDNSITIGFDSYDKAHWQEALMQIYLYRIAEDGTLCNQGKPRLIKSELHNLSIESLQGLSDGGALLAYTEGDLETSAKIGVKRIDPAGNDVWLKDIIVTEDSDSRSAKTYALSDGTLFLAWLKTAKVMVQGVTPNGNLMWPEPGIQITDENAPVAYAPTIQGINTQGSVLIVWHQVSSSTAPDNLHGQLVNPDGALEWGVQGVVIKEGYQAGYCCSLVNDTTIFVYRKGFSNSDSYQTVEAVALGPHGNFCWPNEVVLNNVYSNKQLCIFSPIMNDQGVVLLGETGGDLEHPRLVAQNIWKDGTLGLKSSATDPIQVNSGIHIYAPCGKEIRIEGVTSPCEVRVYNIQGYCCFQQRSRNTDNQPFRINTQHWSPGVYVVKVLSTSGKTACSKILIQ